MNFDKYFDIDQDKIQSKKQKIKYIINQPNEFIVPSYK